MAVRKRSKEALERRALKRTAMSKENYDRKHPTPATPTSTITSSGKGRELTIVSSQ
eukprot:Awhi_evm1s12586